MVRVRCRADGDVQGDVTPYTVTVTLVWGMEAEAEAVVCIAGHWKMNSRVHSSYWDESGATGYENPTTIPMEIAPPTAITLD